MWMRMQRQRLAIFELVVYQNVVGEVAIAQRELNSYRSVCPSELDGTYIWTLSSNGLTNF